MTITMTLPAAVVSVVLLVLFGMLIGAALMLDVLARRQPPPEPLRVTSGYLLPPGPADTAPFPAATFYMSEWLAEVAADQLRAEQATRWLIDAGELAIPARTR